MNLAGEISPPTLTSVRGPAVSKTMDSLDLVDRAALLASLDKPQLSGLGLAPHEESRRLVRLIQCPACSKPFSRPVTLPCGRTLCRSCLAPPRDRSRPTYPNLAERRQEIACSDPDCGLTHSLADCTHDVVLGKIMKAISDVVEARSISGPGTAAATYTEQAPTIVTFRHVVTDSCRGRLIDTYNLASLGLLDHLEETCYDDQVAPASSPTLQKGIQRMHIHETHTGSTRAIDDIVLEELFESTYKELDCQVCYSVFLDPVTTPCGHTFCRSCLAESLNLSTSCPACRRALYLPPSLTAQPSNKILADFLMALCPDMIAARARLAASNPRRAAVGHYETPLFVVGSAFPNTPMFLRIFEPRYRLMLRRALEGDHTFGIISHNWFGTAQGDLGRTQFMLYGTLMEIEYSQLLDDGTSLVEARGVSRFRVRSYDIRDGYYVGQVERVEDVSLAEEERIEIAETTTEAAAGASAFVESFVGMGSVPDPATMTTQDMLTYGLEFILAMRIRSANWLNVQLLTVHGEPPDDAALFPYWLASVLPIEEPLTYQLLTTTSVRQRLQLAMGWIMQLQAQSSFRQSTAL